jgi:D-lactate dehydrogenase
MLRSQLLVRGLAAARSAAVAAAVRRSSSAIDHSICFFDSRPYWIKPFDEFRGSAEIKHVGVKLSVETAILAQGCQAACIFVNDLAGEAELRALKDNGVEMLALRCAGFNNVDLK